jgi:hypothetical protein
LREGVRTGGMLAVKKPDESSLLETVPLVCGLVFVTCVAAIVIVAVKEKRRTGKWPEAVESFSSPGWTFLVWMASSIAHDELPRALHRLPLNILVPAFDTALLIGAAVAGGFALSYSFRCDWNWRVGVWQAARLVIVGLCVWLWVRDLGVYHSQRWVWFPAGILAAFLAPYAVRIAYADLVGRPERSTEGERRDTSTIRQP